MKSLHGLLNRSVVVEPVALITASSSETRHKQDSIHTLQNVDVLDLETRQGSLDAVKDVL